MRKLIWLILLLTIVAFAIAYAIERVQWTIRNQSRLYTINVGIYSDENCTEPLEYINWGVFVNNESKITTAYIHNEGSWSVTLTMQYANFSPPEAANFFVLTWDAENETLQPNTTIMVHFNLTSIVTDVPSFVDFTFDIYVIGVIEDETNPSFLVHPPG